MLRKQILLLGNKKCFCLKSKGLAKLGNIVAETLFLVMFPWVAKLAGNKENVLLPQWQNEETLLRKQMSYACVQ